MGLCVFMNTGVLYIYLGAFKSAVLYFISTSDSVHEQKRSMHNVKKSDHETTTVKDSILQLLSFAAAVITAVPGDIGVIVPAEDTVATDVLDEVQV